jgi:hypothetical protein
MSRAGETRRCEARHLLEVRRLHTPLLHVFLSGCPKAGCEVFIFSTERHVSVNAAGV